MFFIGFYLKILLQLIKCKKDGIWFIPGAKIFLYRFFIVVRDIIGVCFLTQLGNQIARLSIVIGSYIENIVVYPAKEALTAGRVVSSSVSRPNTVKELSRGTQYG